MPVAQSGRLSASSGVIAAKPSRPSEPTCPAHSARAVGEPFGHLGTPVGPPRALLAAAGRNRHDVQTHSRVNPGNPWCEWATGSPVWGRLPHDGYPELHGCAEGYHRGGVCVEVQANVVGPHVELVTQSLDQLIGIRAAVVEVLEAHPV